MVATFRQPFDLLTETTAVAARSSAVVGLNSSKNEIWLGDLDSNQDARVRAESFTTKLSPSRGRPVSRPFARLIKKKFVMWATGSVWQRASRPFPCRSAGGKR